MDCSRGNIYWVTMWALVTVSALHSVMYHYGPVYDAFEITSYSLYLNHIVFKIIPDIYGKHPLEFR